MFVGMKFPSPISLEEASVVPANGKSSNKRAAKRPQGDAKAAKKRRVQARRPRPENTHTGRSCRTGRWTKEEHEKFLQGINVYGKEWKKIAGMIETRTVVQIRTHAQKYFQKLAKKRNQEMKHADSGASGGTRAAVSSAKKKSRRSQKSRASTNSLSPRTAPVTTTPSSASVGSGAMQKKAAASSGIPFKSMNLTLQLPSEDGGKGNHREKSPTSVADLGDFTFMAPSIFGDSILSTGYHGDDNAIPLSNWLNDVKVESDSSDTSSLGSAGHDTIYLDTRYGLESLEPYDCSFEGDSMFSLPSLPPLLDQNALPL